MKKYKATPNTKIQDVLIKKIEKRSDERGFLAEILRSDENLLSKFGQLTFTVSFPGIIKAFHYHKKQDDLWFCPFGNIQIVLFDMREGSPTYKQRQVIFAGENNFILVLIPAGVAHGYNVLGKEKAGLFYTTTESYNAKNPDEFRIPFDDPEINMDWEVEPR